MKIEKDKPLPSHTKLDIWEAYAKIVLEDLFPERYSDLTVFDRPDLQNKDGNIGIEVTWAKKQEQQKAESLYALLYETENESKQKKIISQIEKCGSNVSTFGVLSRCGSDGFRLINKAVDSKNEKGKMYRSFRNLELFIFSDTYADDSMLDEELKYLLELKETLYNKIYVFIPQYLYLFDIAGKKWQKLYISHGMQFEQAKRARAMVEEAENNG